MEKLARFLLNEKLVCYKWSYLLQSVMAAAYILIIYFLLDIFRDGWAIAPLAASTFIAFSIPSLPPARPRCLVGGYLIASGTGCLFSFLHFFLKSRQIPESHAISCGLAMLLTMLLMACLDCKHPPAAALAITLVLTEEPVPVAIAAVLCIAALSFTKQLLSPWMQDL